MNDMIVGMENLPNVFINKILISPTSTGGSLITVVLVMYDSEVPSWKDKIQDLKVKVVFESRQNEIEALNSGEASLFNYPASPVGMSTNDPYDSYVFSANDFSLSRNTEGYLSFVKRVEYAKPLRENLNIYAASFVDDLGFNNHPVFSKYYGPIAAEQIFVGSQLSTLSNYFYYPDTNEEYGGPVHQKPDGSYMEGSEHSDQPHKDVTLVVEENYKIQAYNVDFSVGLAPDNTGDIGSAGNLREFLETDRQAGRPGLFEREYDVISSSTDTPTGPNNPGGPQSNYSPQGPTLEDPNVPDSIPDGIY
jgi:hypothetical protein